MIKLNKVVPEGWDCTAVYDVSLDKDYTVKSCIDALIKERKEDYGTITAYSIGFKIAVAVCDYSKGNIVKNLLTDSSKYILDKSVVAVRAIGSCDLMDYTIEF